MKKLSLFLVSAVFAGSMIGQTSNVGGPFSASTKSNLKPLKNGISTPQFDLQSVLEANAYNEANKLGPYMFGYEHQVNYSLSNSGEWQTLNNGDRVWRMRVKSDGALSLNFVFNDFELPQGAHLHIYNVDRTMVVGAYTAANNNENNQLGTDLVKGDEAIIEYFEPKAVSGQGRLMLATIVHGYRDINGWYTEKVNESGACNLDVICPDGTPWSDEKRAVARIVVGGGLCSGTLVNNTAQDGTPYFLTANHCGPASMGSAVFRFNYDSPTCGSQSVANSTTPTGNNSVNGSSLRASKADSDFGLVELNTTPPASYNVYYAGWDNSGVTPQTATGIHHPSGDVKKISFDDDVLQSAAGLSSVANSEWRIEAWERNTTTEGGSSGSGLWDENHRLVGQLHGGQATCSNSINDYYGKFSMSWDGNGSSSSSQRLEDWLDPQGSGVTTLDGYDPNAVSVANDAGLQSGASTATLCSSEYTPELTIKNGGTTTLTSATITYNVDGGTNQVYNWSGSLATNATEVVTLPSMTVSGSGSHTFNATVSNPNGQTDENSANDVIASSFNAVPNSMPMYLNLLVDCYGEEVAWTIVEQGSSFVLFSGANYPGTGSSPIANGTTVTEEFCLANGCYTFEITDTYGDGMSGSQYNGCNVDGDYDLQDFYGNTFFSMTATAADYGNGTTHDFCITSVGVEEEVLDSQIGVYPNPTDGIVSVLNSNKDNTIEYIAIYDVKGSLVLNQNVLSNQEKTTIDISSLEKGVYILRVSTEEGSVTRKLVRK